ncbi:toxin BrnT, partial [Candidatus Termititenax persephonae]
MFCIDNLYIHMLSFPAEFEFEWDAEKNKKNLEKHGIDFADAQCIFKDKFFRISYDAKHSYGEKRWKVIGNVGKILVI